MADLPDIPKENLFTRLEKFEPSPTLAYFLITLATILWASSIVIGRGVHETIPPVGLSFWRWSFGGLVLAPFVWPELKRKRALILKHWKLITLLGVLQVGSSTIIVLSVNFTTAINGTLINGSQPALTAIIAWILIRDRVTWGQGLGIIAGLVGVVIIIARADLGALLAVDINRGDGLAILAVLGWAVYATCIPRLPLSLGVATTLFLIIATGSVAAVPVYLYEHFYIRQIPLNGTMLLVTAGLGVFVSVFSIFIWNAGVRAIGPNRASIFLNLIPLSGAFLAVLTLGEQIFAYHYVGAALVCLGITMVIKLKRRDP